MKRHEQQCTVIVIQGIIIAWLILMLMIFSGCAALPAAAAGYFTSGGVTLYKSAKEYGPKAEIVVLKVESNHIVYQGTSCNCTKQCRK